MILSQTKSPVSIIYGTHSIEDITVCYAQLFARSRIRGAPDTVVQLRDILNNITEAKI